VKQINFHLSIGERDHDYEVKMRHVEESLWSNEDVTLQLKFRGSEMPRRDSGLNLISRMRDDLAQIGVAESEPESAGKSIKLTLSPLPLGKRKRKFFKDDNSNSP
jgi:translation initiation factor IF-3